MDKNIGSRIRQARKALNLDQRDVARRVHLSVNTISKWETGKSYPSPGAHLDDLVKALEVDMVWLVTGISLDRSEERIGRLLARLEQLDERELIQVELFLDALMDAGKVRTV